MRGAASHVVAVVAPTMVVGHQPGVGFGLELADGGEAAPVEGRAPALLEDGLVEALAHRAVVWRTGRDPMVPELLGDQGRDEGSRPHIFGTVVTEHGPDPDPVTPIGPEHLVDESDAARCR